MRSGKEKNVRRWVSAAAASFERVRHRQEAAKAGRMCVERFAVLKESFTVPGMEDIVVKMEVKTKDRRIKVRIDNYDRQRTRASDKQQTPVTGPQAFLLVRLACNQSFIFI